MPGKPITVLLLDNYDSFTYILRDYLLQLGVSCTVVKNDTHTLEQIKAMHPERLVISPGPGKPQDAGILMEVVAYFIDKIPMLGVCLGHQAIGLHLGATLTHATRPMHGKTAVVHHHNHPMFDGVPDPFEVMRYHSLILTQTEATPLDVIAATPALEIMAVAHQTLPVWGMQFHPESVGTPYGKQMLQNWLRYTSDSTGILHHTPH